MESLLREFYEKHVERFTKTPFDNLTEAQKDAVKQIPAFQIFAKDRENLIKAVKR